MCVSFSNLLVESNSSMCTILFIFDVLSIIYHFFFLFVYALYSLVTSVGRQCMYLW